MGDKFYLIEQGEAIATQSVDGGEVKQVFEYKANDYFGELALLKQEPRAANIIAKVKPISFFKILIVLGSFEGRLD